MWIRAMTIWLLLVVGAIANGTFRVAFLEPALGMEAAHVVSSLLLCVIILVVSWATLSWIRVPTARQAWMVGTLWVGSTLVFEFGFGHWISGKSWETLLADYNIMAGRIWILILVTTFTAPRLVQRLR